MEAHAKDAVLAPKSVPSTADDAVLKIPGREVAATESGDSLHAAPPAPQSGIPHAHHLLTAPVAATYTSVPSFPALPIPQLVLPPAQTIALHDTLRRVLGQNSLSTNAPPVLAMGTGGLGMGQGVHGSQIQGEQDSGDGRGKLPSRKSTDEEYYGSWCEPLRQLQVEKCDDKAVRNKIMSLAAEEGWECNLFTTRTKKDSGWKQYVFGCGHPRAKDNPCKWRLSLQREDVNMPWCAQRHYGTSSKGEGRGTNMMHLKGYQNGQLCTKTSDQASASKGSLFVDTCCIHLHGCAPKSCYPCFASTMTSCTNHH